MKNIDSSLENGKLFPVCERSNLKSLNKQLEKSCCRSKLFEQIMKLKNVRLSIKVCRRWLCLQVSWLVYWHEMKWSLNKQNSSFEVWRNVGFGMSIGWMLNHFKM